MELLDLCPLETWKSLEIDIREHTGIKDEKIVEH
jgi:hypothetical protein